MNEEKIRSFLNSLGVETVENDPLMEYIAAQVREYICNATNLDEVPEGLSWCLVYRTAGQYLQLKRNMGQLNLEGLDLESPAKQIQEGDTNIVFAVDTELSPERRLEKLILSLTEAGKDQFGRYRRLVW